MLVLMIYKNLEALKRIQRKYWHLTFPREGAFKEEIKGRRGSFPSIIFELVSSKVGGVHGEVDIMTRWWWKILDSQFISHRFTQLYMFWTNYFSQLILLFILFLLLFIVSTTLFGTILEFHCTHCTISWDFTKFCLFSLNSYIRSTL